MIAYHGFDFCLMSFLGTEYVAIYRSGELFGLRPDVDAAKLFVDSVL